MLLAKVLYNVEHAFPHAHTRPISPICSSSTIALFPVPVILLLELLLKSITVFVLCAQHLMRILFVKSCAWIAGRTLSFVVVTSSLLLTSIDPVSGLRELFYSIGILAW